MTSLKMYCFSLANSNLEKIKKINYIPVGLGKEIFDKEWIKDNTGNHISKKNTWYGENTFYYWLWKNDAKVWEKAIVGSYFLLIEIIIAGSFVSF